MSFPTSRSIGESFACPKMSLFEMLVETAGRHANQPAMYFYDRTIEYGTLLRQVEQISAHLHANGIGKGDRVGIMLPNCPQYVTAFYACARLGAIVVQVNPMYTPREVEYTLQDAGAKGLVLFDKLLPALAEKTGLLSHLNTVLLVRMGPQTDGEWPPHVTRWEEALGAGLEVPPPAFVDAKEDVAVLQYTGGTTGRSKGAMLTHRNLVANTLQSIHMLGGDQISPKDKILTAIPLFHVYGMTVAMNMALFTGASLILLPRFDTLEVLQTIQAHRPRFFPGVPTMYVAIASHPQADEYGVDCIEICNSGSAPLPVEVLHRFESRTKASVLEGYGLSEASPVTHSNQLGKQRKPGSIGQVIPGTEAAIVDIGTGEQSVPVGEIGELIVKGPQVMKGYWNMPQETEHSIRSGWLYTGDIARMDEDGFFYIVDRKKDMIISSGYNIYPRDVEEVLYQHPSVQEAVVVGVPDEYRGETVKAFLVLQDGVSAAGIEEELDAFCRERLAAYKVPRIYEVRSELPKTAVGKVLRRALRNA